MDNNLDINVIVCFNLVYASIPEIQMDSDNQVSLDPVLHHLGLNFFKDNATTEISKNDRIQ